MAEDFRLLGQQLHGTSCEKKSTVMHPETCVEQILLSHEASDTLKKWITTPPNGSVQRTLPFEGSLYQWLIQNYPVNGMVDLSNYYNKEYIDELARSLNLLATINSKGMMSPQDYTKLLNVEANAQQNVQSDWEQEDTTADDYIKNKPDIRRIIEEIAVGVKILVVESLPTEDIKYDTIYFVPTEHGSSANVYDEYVRIKEENPEDDHWEKIGSTELDLSQVFDEGLNYNSSTGKVSTNASIIKTTEPIQVLGWEGQIGSGTYQSGDTIEAGTPIQSILKSLLFNLYYPNAATLPSASLSVGSLSGVKQVGTEVTIPGVSFSLNDGAFNADYDNVQQPLPSIEWNRKVLETQLINGFGNYSASSANTPSVSSQSTFYKRVNGSWSGYVPQSGETADIVVYQSDRTNPDTSKWGNKEGMIVEVYQTSNERTSIAQQTNIKVSLGTNKVKYIGSTYYTKSFTDPLKNDGTGTTKTGASEAEDSAKWSADQSSPTPIERTIVGVLPCYSNINGSSLEENANTLILVTSSNQVEFTYNDIPSEVTNNKHFKFEFPNGSPSVVRTVSSFKIKDLSGNWIPYAATYTTESAGNKIIDGVSYPYTRLVTTGSFQGSMSLKITLSKSLNQ